MNSGKMVFAQLTDWIHPQLFQRCVQRYRGHYKLQSFSAWDQFLCLSFAQLTYRESLRDIEACLRARSDQLYHLGIRGPVSRSTLAYHNEHRDWRIFADLAQALIRHARRLYATEELEVELEQTAYALDATTIDLCLHLFPWARFRRTKSAVKLHTLLDVRGSIPCAVHVTEGRVHEVHGLDAMRLEAGAIYLLDRGYLDFARLHRIAQAAAYFIIRARSRLQFRRRESRAVPPRTAVRCDQTIRLRGFYPSRAYPDCLRRVCVYDARQQRTLVFLTNQFDLSAAVVGELYRLRWRVELFFKWIKQHLRIKNFYGTSSNAVRTQVWTALCVYVLVAIVKKKLKIEASLFTMLQVLSVSAFEKVPLRELFAVEAAVTHDTHSPNQLLLKGL